MKLTKRNLCEKNLTENDYVIKFMRGKMRTKRTKYAITKKQLAGSNSTRVK